MLVSTILGKMEEALDQKRYRLEYDREALHVRVETDSALLGRLSQDLRDFATRFGIDSSRFEISSPREGVVAAGFLLPYLRILGRGEVRDKYVYIERQFRDYFPLPGKRFTLTGNEERYLAICSLNDRIHIANWYNDNPDVKEGDTISVWWPNWPSEQEEHYLSREYLITWIEEL